MRRTQSFVYTPENQTQEPETPVKKPPRCLPKESKKESTKEELEVLKWRLTRVEDQLLNILQQAEEDSQEDPSQEGNYHSTDSLN